MENENLVDWNYQVIVDPDLSFIETTNLLPFEINGMKIEIIKHDKNKTFLNLFFERGFEKFDDVKNSINEGLNYFLGLFELEGSRSYSFKFSGGKNTMTGEVLSYAELELSKPINKSDEVNIKIIDDFVKSTGKSKIVKAISAFHFSRMATTQEHAFLSISNAFNYLIGDIGQQNRTRCSGTVAVTKLFYENIIKDEKIKKKWEKDITWIHDTIDAIRYENKQVDESDTIKATTLFNNFINLYIEYFNKINGA